MTELFGEDATASTVEAGLKHLVLGPGPDVRDLCRRKKGGYDAILGAAATPADWTQDAKASAVLAVIQELVEQIKKPNWRTAALAAFRLPATDYVGTDCDSREGRWKALAHREGASPLELKRQVERYRDYWRSCASKLAADLEDRLRELNRSPDGWRRFQAESPPQTPLPLAPPISFDRTEVLYEFDGRRGVQCTSHRWLRAHEPVDHYDAVGWYYSEPSASVEIIPLANCSSDGPMHELPMGGVLGRLRFSHALASGEQYYFAYVTRFNSSQPCRPTILYEVRGAEIRNLTVRVQYDVRILPGKIWYFDLGSQGDGWQIPEADAQELLHVAPNGYIEHDFEVCRRGRMYGLRWEWPASE